VAQEYKTLNEWEKGPKPKENYNDRLEVVQGPGQSALKDSIVGHERRQRALPFPSDGILLEEQVRHAVRGGVDPSNRHESEGIYETFVSQKRKKVGSISGAAPTSAGTH
jgi:hypothetical protein